MIYLHDVYIQMETNSRYWDICRKHAFYYKINRLYCSSYKNPVWTGKQASTISNLILICIDLKYQFQVRNVFIKKWQFYKFMIPVTALILFDSFHGMQIPNAVDLLDSYAFKVLENYKHLWQVASTAVLIIEWSFTFF